MAWDKAKPAGTDVLQDSDNDIVFNNTALEAALDQDHDFSTGSTQTGKHTQITFKAPISTPANSPNEGYFYMKDVAGKAEAHIEDEDGNEIQITTVGKIKSASLDMKDEDDMASDSASHAATQQSIKAYSDAGTQTMTNKTLTSPVINTGISGTAIKDEDDMVSDSATAVPTQQSTKAYIDTEIAAAVPDDDAFGSWASKSDNTVYEAASDGFVCAYYTGGSSQPIVIKTDSSNPPTTVRLSKLNYQYGGSLTCPVKKGDFWKTENANVVWWLPIGA